MLKKYAFLGALMSFLFLAHTASVRAQGCSDAGFCTLEEFQPKVIGDAMTPLRNQLRIGAGIGSADHAIAIGNYAIEYTRRWNERWSNDVRLTSLMQSGAEHSSFGLSDLYVMTNYTSPKAVTFSVGLKAPLNNANEQHQGLALPMDYQPSLGTLDLITGVSFRLGNWQFAAAYQQPLSQNENTFLSELYEAGSPFRKFQSTNQFVRSGDVLLRVAYPFAFGKLRITPSILPIYHLADDKFTNLLGKQESIVGSQGLTLNGNVFLDYLIREKHKLQLSVGMPFVVRDARPDGLTRAFVLGLEYAYSF